MNWKERGTGEAHLSEEQLDLLLRDGGQPGPEAQAHLGACAECRCEVEDLRASLVGFRAASTRHAEVNFASQLHVNQPGLFQQMWRSSLAWPLSLAAAGVLCAASMSAMHRPATPAPVAMNQSAGVDAANDASLLDGIDQDLATSIPPSLQPLSVNSGESAKASLNHDFTNN